MKTIVALFPSALLLALTFGCNSEQIKKMDEKIQGLETRVEQLEKKATAARPQAPAPQTAAYDLPVGNSYVLGEKAAPVTVTVFSDYQCPFCGSADPILREALKDPDLKTKVNLVFKHFPLPMHPNARPAAKAALAAGEQGNDKFWAMSEKLFKNQRELSADNYVKWAKEIGLNVTKFENDLKNNEAKYEAIITADMQLGTSAAKVRGTPAIYVGGWELQQRSVAGIKSLIAEKKLGK